MSIESNNICFCVYFSHSLKEKEFPRKVESLATALRTRWGIEAGESGSNLLITCKPLIGRKYVYKNGDQVTIERQWADQESVVLSSATVHSLREQAQDVAEFQTVRDVFAMDKLVFILNLLEYGKMVRSSVQLRRKLFE